MFARKETVYGYTYKNENYKEGDMGFAFYVLKERRDFALASALRGGFTEVSSFEFTADDLQKAGLLKDEINASKNEEITR